MFFSLSSAFVFLCLVNISSQSTDDGIPPELTVNLATVQLAEREDARVRLGAGPVVTCVDADGDAVRAYVSSVQPTSGCGMQCLQLEPVTGNPSDFKLMFKPTNGFATTPSYTLTIGCTDDAETPVEKTMGVVIVSNTPPTFNPNSPPY
ncbi:hypothetical protein EGW08_019182, partial [Elysia chlorotica]